MTDPSTKKRGGNPDVKPKPRSEKSDDKLERKLEQGLEESDGRLRSGQHHPAVAEQARQEADRQRSLGMNPGALVLSGAAHKTWQTRGNGMRFAATSALVLTALMAYPGAAAAQIVYPVVPDRRRPLRRVALRLCQLRAIAWRTGSALRVATSIRATIRRPRGRARASGRGR